MKISKRLTVPHRCTVLAAVVTVTIGVLAAPASATWSIVGVDPDSGEVGAAVASCVPVEVLDTSDGFEITALSPRVGAGITQALLHPPARVEIQRLLDAGTTADAIIATVTDPAFDDGAADRQHGVVLLTGEAAAFTGDRNADVAVDLQGTNVSAQGNILTGTAVIEDAIAAFEAGDGTPLGERLVNALEAGSLAGGDSRCGEQTALFAHVAVIDGEGSHAEPNIVDLTSGVDQGSGENPVTILAAAYRNGLRFDDSVTSEQDDDASTGLPLVLVIAALLLAAAAVGFLLARRSRS